MTGCVGGRSGPAAGRATGLVAAGTLLVAFGLLAAGVSWFWVAFPVGFGVVLPAVAGAAGRGDGHDDSPDGTDRALATLRERYAAGELDEDAFEARVERLLRTETVADARELGGDRGRGPRRRRRGGRRYR